MGKKLKERLSSWLGFDISFLAKNSFWMTSASVTSIVSKLIFSVVFARIASKELFGNYNLILSIFSLATIISMPSFNVAITRALSKGYDGTYKKAVRTMLSFGFLGIPAVFLLGLYYYYKIKLIGITLMASALLFPLYSPFQAWTTLLQAKEKFKSYAIYSLIYNIVLHGLVILVMLLTKLNISFIFLSYISLTVALNLIFYMITKKELKNNKLEKGWKKTGYKLVYSVVFNRAYSYLDKITLMFFLNAEMLAVYSIATVIAENLKAMMNNIIRVYVPKLFRASLADLLKSPKKRLAYFFIFSGIGCVILAALVPWIIKILYSDKYTASIIYAQLYIMIIPFYVLSVVSGQILIKEKKENIYVSSLVSAGAINILLYLVLIPLFGIIGAVLSSIMFYAIQSFIRAYYVLRLKEISKKF